MVLSVRATVNVGLSDNVNDMTFLPNFTDSEHKFKANFSFILNTFMQLFS